VVGDLPYTVTDAGHNVTYSPNADRKGAEEGKFKANDGIVDSTAAAAISITVNPVNDPPVASAQSVNTNEDTTKTVTLSGTDVDGAAPTIFKVTTLPASGKLYDGTGTGGHQIVAGDLAGGSYTVTDAGHNVTYSPNADFNGADAFNFKANDGIVDSTAAAAISITVNPVNDAPAGADNTVSALEDGTHVFSTGEFGFSDPNDTPANTLQAVKVTTLPTAGTLTNNGTAVGTGDFVSATDITAGKLVFTPAPDANGAGYASFTFQVQDNGGTLNGGVDLDQSANKITVDVTSVNDAPAGADNTVSALEDGTHVFSTGEFGFSDPNDTPANTLQAVKVTTLPTAGTLTNNGTAVGTGDFVSATDITAGKLVFTPAPDANGAGYASFTFQVQDNGGTLNGGVDLDQSANKITVD